MGKDAFEKIAARLQDALLFAQGDKSRALVHEVRPEDIDVATIRKNLGLSQDKFARAFGVSAATVRGWEQGRRHPTGPARALLKVIDKEPEAVLRSLASNSV